MINWRFFAGLCLVAGLVGCGQKSNANDGENEESVVTILPTEEVEVRTETLRTQDFELEVVSNGRISAQQIAELRFLNVSGGNVPIKIFVQNGNHVEAGAAIAMIDTFQLSNSYQQAVNDLQRAHLELQNELIGQGFTLADSATIPADKFNLARIRSGYNNAINRYELAKYNLDNATLCSPIAGVVTNLFAKPYNPIDPAEPFCIIIAEGKPEVDFRILENELPLIKKGDRVKIQPYAMPDVETTGSVVNINPNVDKDGMVRIKAHIQPHAKIFNGMNVRIGVLRTYGQQWVVPKSAVVLRTGKQVVFTYKNGKASWNYINTGLENSTHCIITCPQNTLQEGDEIIISGNEHLAHDSNVKLAEVNND